MKQASSRGWRLAPGRLMGLVALLVVAFSPESSHNKLANALQQAGDHEAAAAAAAAASAPMMTLSGESSSALESAGALSSDDLIAAESSQAPDAPDQRKAFTSGQMLRQVSGSQDFASPGRTLEQFRSVRTIGSNQ